MWNWISEKVGSAFRFVKRVFDGVGGYVVDAIEVGSDKVRVYCEGNKLRGLVVFTLLFGGTFAAGVLMPVVTIGVLSVAAVLYIFWVSLEEVELTFIIHAT